MGESGELSPNSFGVPWLRHLDDRFRAIELHFELLERAVDKSESQAKERFAGVNEFRATLEDQATHFATRDALDAFRESLRSELRSVREEACREADANRDAIGALKEAHSKQMGRQEALTWGIGVVFTILSLALRFL